MLPVYSFRSSKASIAAASQMTELEVLAEPFQAFSIKLASLVETLPRSEKGSQNKMLTAIQLKYGTQVRYRGRSLNKSMLAAALAVGSMFPADGKGLKLLKLISQWYDKCLGAYSTLYKFCTSVTTFLKETPDGSLSTEDRRLTCQTQRSNIQHGSCHGLIK